jgi:flagellin-specific chaperone FliS
MKYTRFAFIALSLLLVAACNNNPSTPAATDATATGGAQVSGAPIAVTEDAIALKNKVQTDFFAGRAISHPYDSLYDAFIVFGKNIKTSAGTVTGENLEHVRKIFTETMKFTLVYDEHRRQTGNLDSLATKLSEGRISTADAQKEYAATQEAVQAATAKLMSVQEVRQLLVSLKSEFDGIFAGANKKAAGH